MNLRLIKHKLKQDSIVNQKTIIISTSNNNNSLYYKWLQQDIHV